MAFTDRLRDSVDRVRALVPRRQKLLTQEIALADTRRFALFGPTDRYNPDDLVGRKGLYVYDDMRKDEAVKAALVLKTCAIIGPGWSLQADDADDEAQKELADQLTMDLLNLGQTVEDILSQILTAHPYGFSLSEKVFAMDGARLVLEAVKPRAPHEFIFDQDPYGNIEGVRQGLFLDQGDLLPIEKFVHYVHDPEFDNPYGRSDLRAAHQTWFLKRVFLQGWASFMERYADPPVIGKYPKGVTDRTIIDVVHNILKRLQGKTAITVADEWNFELLQTTHSPNEFFIKSIDRLDLMIARACLIPEKIGFSGGEVNAGSFALSKTQMGAFYFVLNQIKARLESVMTNQLIRMMAAFVAPNLPPPYFVLNPLSEENKEAFARLWGELAAKQVVISDVTDENHVRQMLEFPSVEESTEEMRDAILEKKRAREQVQDDLQQKQLDAPATPAAFAAKTPSFREWLWQQRRRIDGVGLFATDWFTPPVVRSARTPEEVRIALHNYDASDGEMELYESAVKEYMAAVPGLSPTPSQADAKPPDKFWRPLRKLEERADMAEQRRLHEEGSTELGLILADNVGAFIQQVKARAEGLLARKSPEEIAGLGVDTGRQAQVFAEAYAALLRSYARGARKARGEVKK